MMKSENCAHRCDLQKGGVFPMDDYEFAGTTSTSGHPRDYPDIRRSNMELSPLNIFSVLISESQGTKVTR